MENPPAEGTRVSWADVPGPVRDAITQICGSAVTEARTQPGGFSPGVAARVVCADGSRHFVKAVSAEANPVTPRLHRQEAAVLAALDADIAARDLPIPRLHGTVEEGPWVALVLDDVDGWHPELPWNSGDLGRVLAALDRLAEALTPAPAGVPTVSTTLGDAFTGWRSLAQPTPAAGLDGWAQDRLDGLAALEATWEEHAAGDTLLHTDIRADNLLLTPDGVVVLDWPGACRGAAFVDPVFFAPSVAMQGGPEPRELMAGSGPARAADPQDLAATVCAMAGYLTHQSLLPAPPGLPTLRTFQAAQGVVARRWLRELI
jgi:hypothetical protein